MRRLSVLLAELQALSPMPSDEELVALPEEGSRRLDKYVELLEAIRQETTAEFPPEVVSVLLSSFGVGDGYEVYWTTVHLIRRVRIRVQGNGAVYCWEGDGVSMIFRFCLID